ncbi:MAG: helix-turn-helix transcriptional regulator [Eubacteriales bacterium]|nr:helix-turn-helix transcriptional regulator [Eubacteriales bacterium]
MQNNARVPVFRDRFNELLKEQSNGNITEFAKLLGLSRQTVGFYLNGDRIPDIETMFQICKKCKIPSDWLIGLSDERAVDQTIRSVCEFTGLSPSTVNFLHFSGYDPDDLRVGFYRKLFDSIVLIGESGLDAIPGYVLEAARAHLIASSEEKPSHIEIENIISAISRNGNTYTIPASSAEDFFLLEAQEEISKALAEVVGRMEDDAIKQFESIGRIDTASLWTIDKDEDFELWYPEGEIGEAEKANGEHQKD